MFKSSSSKDLLFSSCLFLKRTKVKTLTGIERGMMTLELHKQNLAQYVITIKMFRCKTVELSDMGF